MSKISKISPLLSDAPLQKFEPTPYPSCPHCPLPDPGSYIGKKDISDSIYTNFMKHFGCIFRSTIMTYLKKLIGVKSLNSIQNSVQQDYVPKLSSPLYSSLVKNVSSPSVECPLPLNPFGKPFICSSIYLNKIGFINMQAK